MAPSATGRRVSDPARFRRGLRAAILTLWLGVSGVQADDEGVPTGRLHPSAPAALSNTVVASELPVQDELRSFVVPNQLDPTMKRGSAPMPDLPPPGPTTLVTSREEGTLASVPSIDVSFEGPTEGTPPDPSMAAGANHVVVAINRVYSVYDKSGTLVQGPTDLDTFFGIGGFFVSFDPLVIHDPFEDRFVMAMAASDDVFSDSRLYIAFTASNDPTGTWNVYWIDGDDGDPGAAYADYPSIGLDNNAIYVSANMLDRGTGSVSAVTVWSIDKRDGYNGLSTLDFATVLDVRTAGGNVAADLRPAFMPETEALDTYYLARTDAAFGSDAAVFTLTGPRFTTPTITAYDVALPSFYTGPTTARQPGGSPGIDAIGGLMFNAFYRGGKLWGAQALLSGSDIVSWVHRFDVDTLPPTRDQTYTIAETGEDVFLPHVVPDVEDFDFAAVAAYSGPSTHVTGRYYNVDAAGTLRHSEDMLAGEERQDSGRHGDYFSMFPDPTDDNRVWMAAQYVPTSGMGGPGAAIVASALFENGAVPSPPPVPDADQVAGLPLKVNEAPADEVTVSWDPSCATDHHLVFFDFANVSSYAPILTECAVGTSGTWTGAGPAGDWTVLAVANDGVDAEGSYGNRKDGASLTERPASTASCSIVQKKTDGVCP